MSLIRTRWAAIGAAVAVTLGGGGIAMVSATSPAGAVTYVPITPCRVFDTRPDFNVGPKATPIGSDTEHAVTATGTTGECTAVPTNATAVAINLTAVGATLPTFLAVYATGADRPNSSSLNPQPGQPPLPNAVTTELSTALSRRSTQLAGGRSPRSHRSIRARPSRSRYGSPRIPSQRVSSARPIWSRPAHRP